MLKVKIKQEAAVDQRAAVRVSGAGQSNKGFGSVLQRVFKGLTEAPRAAAEKIGLEAARGVDRKTAGPESLEKSSKKQETPAARSINRPERRHVKEKRRSSDQNAAAGAAMAAPAQPLVQRRVVGFDQIGGQIGGKDIQTIGAEAGASRPKPAGFAKTTGAGEGPPRIPLSAEEGSGARSGAGKKAKPAETDREAVRKDTKNAVKVKDLRTERSSEPQTERPPVEPVKAEEPRREIQRDPAVQTAGERETQAAGREQGREAAAEGAAEIRRQFREEANQRIVREAAVVLRDRDEGEIRLVLRPENLGRVRIKLELHDNRIEGTFFVENGNIREIVEQNLPDLARAFRDSGFELGSFNVAVGDERRRQSREEAPRVTVRGEEKAAPLYELGASPFEHNTVNIVV